MPTASERVSVLMTPDQKMRLVTKAHQAGISVSEYLRRAALGYVYAKDEQLLCALLDSMNRATYQAEKAIDEALSFISESNLRIELMERQARS